MAERDCIIIDPMLATGYSACTAIGELKKLGVRNIKFMCIICSPEGVEAVQKEQILRKSEVKNEEKHCKENGNSPNAVG